MNGFQHLPEYVNAAHAYRMERIRVERAPRRTGERSHRLRDLLAGLIARPAAAPTPAAR